MSISAFSQAICFQAYVSVAVKSKQVTVPSLLTTVLPSDVVLPSSSGAPTKTV